MSHLAARERGRQARHRRLRKKVIGFPQRPRLAVYRSQKYLYAQLIDDLAGKTLLGSFTGDERLTAAKPSGIAAAEALGKLMAEEIKQRGVSQVVFDRGGYVYHGRVKAFADALRAGGLQV